MSLLQHNAMPAKELWRWQEEIILDGSLAGGRFKRESVYLRELPMADGVNASTGNQLWSSSILLSHLILQRHTDFEDRDVLELGAGCGLCGITAARFARSTRITDGDEEAVRNIAFNVSANEHFWRADSEDGERKVEVELLDWGTVVSSPVDPERRVDVIFASDIIYGFWGDTVANAVLRMLTPTGLILLVASEDRRGGVRSFSERLQAHDFVVKETRYIVSSGSFRLYECQRRVNQEEPLCPTLVDSADENLRAALDAAVVGEDPAESTTTASDSERRPRQNEEEPCDLPARATLPAVPELPDGMGFWYLAF